MTFLSFTKTDNFQVSKTSFEVPVSMIVKNYQYSVKRASLVVTQSGFLLLNKYSYNVSFCKVSYFQLDVRKKYERLKLYKQVAAVSCSANAPCLGGVGFGIW